MAFWDNQSLDQVFYELREAIRTLETQSPLRSSSITEGRLRVGGTAILLIDSDGGVVIEGRLTGNGAFKWTRLAEFTGEFKSTGPALFDGDVEITKTLDVTAATKLRGLLELLNDMRVKPGGKITVEGSSSATLEDGKLSFSTGAKLEADGAGARLISGTGPRVYVFPTAVALQYDPTHYVLVTGTQTTVKGPLVADSLTVSGSKLFSMPHPTKPGMLIQHGATESPVSGVEYWGDDTIATDGAAVVVLPDYFEALTKEQNRSVFVSGRGFAADWTDIDAGTFTVRGRAGGKFSWLVKAERFGGDFAVEKAQPAEATASAS